MRNIGEAILEARLAELKWAVAAQELRLREREEQRRIQEQIREEEKARRDAERAIKEAEKEESLLHRHWRRRARRWSQPRLQSVRAFSSESTS